MACVGIDPAVGLECSHCRHVSRVPYSALLKLVSVALQAQFTVDRDDFSLNATVVCQAHQRQQLERLCRYATRPALCLERLSVNEDGKIVPELKHPFRDGTTHILFSLADFVARLASLVPRPRANLSRYNGTFAPNSPHRDRAWLTRWTRAKYKASKDSKPRDLLEKSAQPAAGPRRASSSHPDDNLFTAS